MIEKKPGITAQEIADELGIHIINVYIQIKKLEKTNGHEIVRDRSCKYTIKS